MEPAYPLPALAARSQGVVAMSADERLRRTVRLHYDFLWRSLRRLGVVEAQCDDAAQQVLVVFSRKLADVPQENERSFLFGTAIRVASDYRKQSGRRREVGDDDAIDAEPSVAPGADELVDQRRARELLDHVLDAMPDELRTVLVLAEIEGMTMSETADLLAIPPGTVASRLRRARIAFEEQVAILAARGRSE
jgi:RNA polymerase sigma-70 factor, ECF subfamily